jgi:hypothetical protein
MRRAVLLSVLTAAILICSTGVAQAAPTLSINRTGFDTCDTDWTITVTGATPNSAVYLTEWGGWYGAVMSIVWGAGQIGTTDSNGNFSYTTGAPSSVNNFVAYVEINGQLSNPLAYYTGAC